MKLHPVLLEMEKIRKDKTLTRLYFSIKTGVSVNTMASWYNKGQSPGLYNIASCLDYLGYELCIKKKEKKK